MSMQAKVLINLTQDGSSIDVFDLVGRVEKAINALVREKQGNAR